MVIVSPQWRMSIKISCNYSFCINCVCQGCERAVIPWRVVDVENCVLAFTVPDRYLVEISGTISFYFFNGGIDIIPNVGDDSSAVWAVVITRGVCVVAYVGVCVLMLGFLDKGHVDVLLTEEVGQNNISKIFKVLIFKGVPSIWSSDKN